MKVKIFSGQCYFSDNVEERVNTWLESTSYIRITEIKQTQSGDSQYNHYVTITIIYEE